MTLPAAGLGEAYRDAIVDTGKQPELFFLLAFLVTFGFIRTSTHMIRAGVSWWPGNLEVKGTHIHHLVWGILLVLAVGYVGIAIAPGDPWREVLAVLFGTGAALTLDEFALWLNLKDVYWTAEGRRSIDAVIVAAVLAALVILGARIWVDLATGVEDTVAAIVGTVGAVNLVLVLVNFAKEKFATGIVGLLVSPVSLVGAIRLARPSSPWAKLFYGEKRMARARTRFDHRRPWQDHLRWRKRQSVARSG